MRERTASEPCRTWVLPAGLVSQSLQLGRLRHNRRVLRQQFDMIDSMNYTPDAQHYLLLKLSPSHQVRSRV